jgi:hypothetical protein
MRSDWYVANPFRTHYNKGPGQGLCVASVVVFIMTNERVFKLSGLFVLCAAVLCCCVVCGTMEEVINPQEHARHPAIVPLYNWGVSYGGAFVLAFLWHAYQSASLKGLVYPVVCGFLPFLYEAANMGLSRMNVLTTFRNGSVLSSRILFGCVDVLAFSVLDFLAFGWAAWQYHVIFLLSWIVADLLPVKVRLISGIVVAVLSLLQNIAILNKKRNLLKPIYDPFLFVAAYVGSLVPAGMIMDHFVTPLTQFWGEFTRGYVNVNAPTTMEHVKFVYRAFYPFLFPLHIYFASADDQKYMGLRSLFSTHYLVARHEVVPLLDPIIPAIEDAASKVPVPSIPERSTEGKSRLPIPMPTSDPIHKTSPSAKKNVEKAPIDGADIASGALSISMLVPVLLSTLIVLA